MYKYWGNYLTFLRLPRISTSEARPAGPTFSSTLRRPSVRSILTPLPLPRLLLLLLLLSAEFGKLGICMKRGRTWMMEVGGGLWARLFRLLCRMGEVFFPRATSALGRKERVPNQIFQKSNLNLPQIAQNR